MVGSRPTRASAGRSAGFSFVELMLVVVVLGIVTAVGVQIVDNDERKLDATARELVADMLEAQSLAIETRVPFGLLFDVAQNQSRFVIADGTTPKASEVPLRLLVALDTTAVDRLLAAESSGRSGFGDVTLTAADFGGRPRLVWNTDGTPQDGGLVDLRLGAFTLRIRVQAVTGRIVITAP